jgi:hypothetical protein
MWRRLGVLGAGVAALRILLFWPISIDIRVDLPPAKGGGARWRGRWWWASSCWARSGSGEGSSENTAAGADVAPNFGSGAR